jgi:hypothetical protein
MVNVPARTSRAASGLLGVFSITIFGSNGLPDDQVDPELVCAPPRFMMTNQVSTMRIRLG